MDPKAPMGEISARALGVGDLVSWKERQIDEIYFWDNKSYMGIIRKIYLKNVNGRELKFLEIVESSTGKLKKDISPMIVRVVSKISG
tara:strand:+ start:230 stop:490 length:261 start_codon:yes stop_codon:yes gene_type:complete